MNAENALWKQRYEKLKQFMADAEFEIRNEPFERATERAWDAPNRIFVSFAFEVVDSEDTAKEKFGEGKYDVYKLERKGSECGSDNDD